MNKLLQRIYPFLIAVYPVLALKNLNSNYVDLPSITRTLAAVLACTALTWFIVHLLVRRDLVVSGVLVSLVMVVALAYGHIYNQLAVALGAPVKHSVLGAVLALALAAAFAGLWRRPKAARGVSEFLSNVAVILFAMALGQAAWIEAQAARGTDTAPAQEQAPAEAEAGQPPDIYLIVLDGHGRSDVLQEEFGYDNRVFTQALQALGFYVAQCSQSNYASTRYSLTSLFQMEYIQIVDGQELVPALKNTPFLLTLRANGYQVITFENYASGHFDLAEDARLTRHAATLGVDLASGLNEFEKTMLATSVTRLLLDTEIVPGFNENTLERLEFYEHYLQTKYILEELPRTPTLPGPKFVFAHILVPHIPHVFTPTGEFRYPEDKSKNGYHDNALFIDAAIVPVIQQILAASPTPPVILVMGDHGPPATKFTSPAARMKNLMALRLGDNTTAYPTITPVNAARVLLNDALGMDLPRLEDESYYAYQFRQLKEPTLMPNTCR